MCAKYNLVDYSILAVAQQAEQYAKPPTKMSNCDGPINIENWKEFKLDFVGQRTYKCSSDSNFVSGEISKIRILDLNEQDIKVGMRVRSLSNPRSGTIMSIDTNNDNFTMIQWDGEASPTSGFYGNKCECELDNGGTNEKQQDQGNSKE